MDIWYLCRRPSANLRLRLFCFPHAGGGVATYRSWADLLPADIEVCAIQLPGRDGRMREQLINELPGLIESLARGLAPAMNVPFAFFGHSMGAIIAYEMVRFGRREGLPDAVHLFVSGRRAPQIVENDLPIHDLPEGQFVEHILNRYNGIPQAILSEPGLMRLFVPVLRADFTMLETYRWIPGEPIETPITAFGGLHDRFVSRAELCAWQELTRGPFDIHMLKGGHFFLQEEQPALLRLIGGSSLAV